MAWYNKYYDVVDWETIRTVGHWDEEVTEDRLFSNEADIDYANIFGNDPRVVWETFGHKNFSKDKIKYLLAKPEYRHAIALYSESGDNVVAFVADNGKVYEFDFDFFELTEEYVKERLDMDEEHPGWDIEDYRDSIREGLRITEDIYGNPIPERHCRY